MNNTDNPVLSRSSAVILAILWLSLSPLTLATASAVHAATSEYMPGQTYALRGRVTLQQRGLAKVHFHIRACQPGQLTTRGTVRHCRQWSVRDLHAISTRTGYWWIKRLPAGYYRIEADADNPRYRIHPARIYYWTNGRSSPLLRFVASLASIQYGGKTIPQ